MTERRWINTMLMLAVLAVSPPRHASDAQTGAGANQVAPATQPELQQLAALLANDSTRQEDKDEAARRLVLRQRDEARELLNNVLISAGNRSGQLAVARALADDPHPDPQLIIPLFALLGPDRALTEAAARALTAYKDNIEVLARLSAVATAQQQPQPVRTAVIKSLGAFLDKRSAQVLMLLLTGEQESPAIHNAAADALSDMTGQRNIGHDIQKWQQWWSVNAAKPDPDWKLALLNERALRVGQDELRYGQLAAQVRSLLYDQYQLIPDARKGELLLRYLRDPEPVIRAVGAKLIFEDAVNNRSLSSAARQQLRLMVGDSSPEVRIEVAAALRALNDPAALEPLLTQLAHEPDSDVRAALARAIAPIRDLRALPQLRTLLHDESFAAAEAAALAIRDLGEQLRLKDPALAAQTATDLRDALEQRTSAPGSQRLREACAAAMVPLRQASLLPVYYKLLRPSESRELRRSALKGLGELGDRNTTDVILNSLEDPDAAVRLEAVDALGKVGSFQNAEPLYRRLSPDQEPDASVRERAWHTLELLLPSAPQEQLSAWAGRFADRPTRRLAVLKVLAEKLKEPAQAQRLAYTRQSIGETLLTLNQPGEAANYFRPALDYFASHPQERMATEALIGQLMGALLKSQQYTQAIAFAAKLIRDDASQQQTVGAALKGEAQRLRDAKEPKALQSAVNLIEEARKMDPPLSPRYAQDLEDILSDIQRRLDENHPTTTSPQSARRTLPPKLDDG